MTNYNQHYYIAVEPKGDYIKLRATGTTKRISYGYKKVDLAEGPLFFTRFLSEEKKKKGVRLLPPTDFLTDNSVWLVNEPTRDFLKNYSTQNMQLAPSIYIDENGVYHESYWLLNFYDELNCLCRRRSKLLLMSDVYDDEDEDEEDPFVDKYYLDEAVLDVIPEEERLVFKIGGGAIAYILFHKKLVDFIEKNNFSGIRFIKVTDFVEGEQYLD